MDKITFKPVALEAQKPTEVKDCYIELHENHIVFSYDFLAEEPTNEDDLALPWEVIRNECLKTVMKKDISGVEMLLSQGFYKIFISVKSAEEDIKIFHKRKSEALAMYEKIKNFITAC